MMVLFVTDQSANIKACQASARRTMLPVTAQCPMLFFDSSRGLLMNGRSQKYQNTVASSKSATTSNGILKIYGIAPPKK